MPTLTSIPWIWKCCPIKWLLVGGLILLLQVAHGQRFKTFSGHQLDVNAVAFSPTGDSLYTASADQRVRLFQTATTHELQNWRPHGSGVNAIALSGSGQWVIGANDGSWSVHSPTRTAKSASDFTSLPRFSEGIEAVAFSPTGDEVAAVSRDGSLQALHLHANWQTLLPTSREPLYALQFLDEDRVVVAGHSGQVAIWSLASGEALTAWQAHDSPVRALAISGDKRSIVTADFGGKVRLWALETRYLRAEWQAHQGIVRHLQFSPDGKLLASGGRDGAIRFWAASDGRYISALRGHTAGIWDLQFHPTQPQLVSASADRTARLWDIAPWTNEVNHDPGEATQAFTPPIALGENMPLATRTAATTYALIIGNESYSRYQPQLTPATDVDYARADARVTARYAEQVLGIPASHITTLLDATSGQLVAGLSTFRRQVARQKNARVVVFYAGHGLPHPVSQEPVLLPVDVAPAQAQLGLTVQALVDTLLQARPERVLILLDACFSGLARGPALVAERGLIIRPKARGLRGPVVVFSAAGADEPALPYRQAQHGLFTYAVLASLHQQPEASLQDWALAVSASTEEWSEALHFRKQHPQLTASPELGTDWMNWRLRP